MGQTQASIYANEFNEIKATDYLIDANKQYPYIQHLQSKENFVQQIETAILNTNNAKQAQAKKCSNSEDKETSSSFNIRIISIENEICLFSYYDAQAAETVVAAFNYKSNEVIHFGISYSEGKCELASLDATGSILAFTRSMNSNSNYVSPSVQRVRTCIAEITNTSKATLFSLNDLCEIKFIRTLRKRDKASEFEAFFICCNNSNIFLYSVPFRRTDNQVRISSQPIERKRLITKKVYWYCWSEKYCKLLAIVSDEEITTTTSNTTTTGCTSPNVSYTSVHKRQFANQLDRTQSAPTLLHTSSDTVNNKNNNVEHHDTQPTSTNNQLNSINNISNKGFWIESYTVNLVHGPSLEYSTPITDSLLSAIILKQATFIQLQDIAVICDWKVQEADNNIQITLYNSNSSSNNQFTANKLADFIFQIPFNNNINATSKVRFVELSGDTIVAYIANEYYQLIQCTPTGFTMLFNCKQLIQSCSTTKNAGILYNI